MDSLRRHLPNLISLLRPLLIIPLIMAIAENRIALLVIIAVVIVISDYIDGYLARIWNAVSESGKIIDPVADKICTSAAAGSLVFYRGFPYWLLIILIARDLLIMGLGLILIRRKRKIPVSNLTGKITMGIMAACLIIYLFDLDNLKLPSVILTLTAVAASSISYAIRFNRELQDEAV
jgi:CDP-diacylglycerol--glycerol-3-phosphate 3-phosphatidyltransferase